MTRNRDAQLWSHFQGTLHEVVSIMLTKHCPFICRHAWIKTTSTANAFNGLHGGDAVVLNRMTTCCGIRTVKARELDDITRLLLWNMQNGAMNTLTTNQPVLWPRQRYSHVVIPPVAQAAKATNTVIKLGSAVERLFLSILCCSLVISTSKSA